MTFIWFHSLFWALVILSMTGWIVFKVGWQINWMAKKHQCKTKVSICILCSKHFLDPLRQSHGVSVHIFSVCQERFSLELITIRKNFHSVANDDCSVPTMSPVLSNHVIKRSDHDVLFMRCNCVCTFGTRRIWNVCCQFIGGFRALPIGLQVGHC